MYEHLGDGALDYLPCRYGRSKLLFRGPKRKLDGAFCAMLGGAETYGRFVEVPFPALVEERTGSKVVNLGCVNAGIDAFAADPSVLDVCSGARLTVVQVLGAQNMSNRFYAVHPRRNDRFLRASTLLKTIYRDVDFTEFNFTRHLLTALRADNAEKFAMVEEELKEAWVARMKTLVAKINARVVLLWLSDHDPETYTTCTEHGGDPLFVDREMLERVRPYVSGVVEVVVGPDEITDGMQGLVYNELEEPMARELLGVSAHEKAARALNPVIEALL